MKTEINILFLKHSRKIFIFFLCLLGAIVLSRIIYEPLFTDSQKYVVFILLFAIGLWLTEVIPPYAVSMLIMSFLVFALGDKHINSAPEKIGVYVQTFSSAIIWLLLGGFFIALAMTKSQLDKALLRFTIRMSGNKPRSLVIGLMATTMIASMLMSNTATTAMVIAAVAPLLNRLGKQSGLSKAIALGVPIAASTGGMASIIGSPPNALATAAIEGAGHEISFLTWMVYGVPLTLVLTSLACFALIKRYVKDNNEISFDFINTADENLEPELKLQRRIVVFVIIVTVALWLTGSLHGVSVAYVSALPLMILTLTGVIKGDDVRSMPWDTLLLVAGGLSLGLALQNTGLLDHYANLIAALNISSMAFLFLFAFVTMLFSNIMSNTATSTVLIPLGLALVKDMQIEIALIIGLATSTAMFLPVSTPPNAVVYSTGMVEQKDFRLGGALIGLLGPLLIVLWVLLLRTLL